MTPLSANQIANSALIYDFETPLESAIAAWFTTNGMSAATTATAPEFQKTRPRVEIEAKHVRGTKKAFGLINGQAGPALNATHRMAILIDVITGTAKENKLAHTAYRALVRLVMNLAPATTCLPNHTIQGPIDDNGSVETFKTSEGWEISRLSFEFDFSVKPDSWQQLAN